MGNLRTIVVCGLLLGCVCRLSWADPVTFFTSFAGNLDFQVTGASLRTQPNNAFPGSACVVTSPATTVNATLSGIPGGATVQAAYLYWAGSGSTPDLTVTFQGTSVTATRSFSETFTFGATNYDFFSGFADVTGLVSGNGSYGFSGLTVNNGAPFCAVQAVVAGWSLVVVYSEPSEPLRVVNIFDGFRFFRASRIDLTPSNFQIPPAGCAPGGDCKFGVISWEGDAGNSGSSGGFSENLFVNPPPPPPALIDAVNPLNNQYNSTISLTGIVGPPNSTTSYGLDIDVYALTSPTHIAPGDTSIQTRYESGQDLVLLSAEVLSVRNTPVADLAISKSHSGDFVAGQAGVYTLSVSNNGPNDETGAITVTDVLPAGLSFTSATSSDANWSCGAVGQTVTCSHPGPLPNGNSLANIDLTVAVAAAAAPSVTNTASVSGTTFDNVGGNNAASDLANVIVPSLSTSTKSVVDLNGGDAQPGDILRYTVDITESAGGAIGGVSVSDTIDALLTGLSVVSVPAGATDNSTPGTGPLSVDNISIPANGSVSVVFDVTILGTANPGDLINNTAVISNPVTAGTDNAVAPAVIVSAGSIPGSGTKQLYFGAVLGSQNNPALPQSLSRLPLTAPSVPQRLRIRRQDTPRRWDLTPSLQTALSLSADPIPVILQMRRNGNSLTRNIRVSVDYAGAANGFWGCLDLSIPGTGATGLSNTITRAFTFNVPQTDANCNPVAAAPLTLPAGTVIRSTVDNEPLTGFSGLAVFVYPFNNNTPDTSRLELPATTVINVDSVEAYDGPFPGGVVQTSYSAGATLYIRAEVSDPFGSYDITAAVIDIIDPSGTTVISAAAMTEVNDSGAANKTYEFQYTVPAVGPDGTWTTRVTADEGTEGVINDLGTGVFIIGSPNISVLKLVSTISDPVNDLSNPKAVPGAIVQYQINVTNTGSGTADADTVVIDDPLQSNLQFFFGSPLNPVQFVDGIPASGLTFNFTNLADPADDVDFSNDGGVTFITPAVDANGFDITVPPVNFIRINPRGTLNGSIGAGDPNFSVIFRARVR